MQLALFLFPMDVHCVLGEARNKYLYISQIISVFNILTCFSDVMGR